MTFFFLLANFQAKVICWKSWVSVTLGKCCAAQIPLCVTSVRSVRLFLVKIYHWFTIDFQQFVVQNPMFVLFPDSIPNLSCIQNPCLSIKIFSVNSSFFLIYSCHSLMNSQWIPPRSWWTWSLTIQLQPPGDSKPRSTSAWSVPSLREFYGWILVVILSWESGNFHRTMMIIDDLIFLNLSCKPLPFQTMGSKLS